jgi:hypothetical protein
LTRMGISKDPTPAARVADRLWDISDIVTLVEAKPANREPYKKRAAGLRKGIGERRLRSIFRQCS